MFSKDDIKAGYVVKLSNGEYCTVNVNNRNQNGIRSIHGLYCDIMNFDENLYCEWRDIYIDEIYGRTANGFLNNDSPKERKLLWSRNEYEVGNKFLIKSILIHENNGNRYTKTTEYTNVEGTISQIWNVDGKTMYKLEFDGHSIYIEKQYLDGCKKVN